MDRARQLGDLFQHTTGGRRPCPLVAGWSLCKLPHSIRAVRHCRHWDFRLIAAAMVSICVVGLVPQARSQQYSCTFTYCGPDSNTESVFILPETSGLMEAKVWDPTVQVQTVSGNYVSDTGVAIVAAFPCTGCISNIGNGYASAGNIVGEITALPGDVNYYGLNYFHFDLANLTSPCPTGNCVAALLILGPAEAQLYAAPPQPPPPPPPPPLDQIRISNQGSFASWEDSTQWLDGNGSTVNQPPNSSNPVYVIPGKSSVFLGSSDTAATVTVESGTLPGETAELDGFAGSSLNTSTLSVIGGAVVSIYANSTIATTGNTVIGGDYVDPTGSYGGAGGSGGGSFDNNGGTHTVGGDLLIGDAANSAGTYSVSSGGTVNVSGQIEVGGAGTGLFSQQDQGSTVTANVLDVGANKGGSGSYTISDGTLTVATNLIVGDQSTGVFSEQGTNALVTTAQLYVGNADGGNGTYNLSAGSLQVAGALALGVAGNGVGTFNQTGGTVQTGSLIIGQSASGSLTQPNGTYNLSGGSLSVLGSGSLTVGGSGSGLLAVSNGSSLTTTTADIGGSASSSSTGVVTVDTFSSWSNGGSLTIGDQGTGTVAVSNGSYVSNGGDLILGNAAGSSGTLTLNGTGWFNSGTVKVGVSGQGNLSILGGGALLVSVGGDIGVNGLGATTQGPPVPNTVTVQAGSWSDFGSLQVGDGGAGQLTISQGGQVNSGAADVGIQNGSIGTVTVTGQGSQWSLGGNALTIADAGSGTMSVQNGGVVLSGTSIIGSQAGATGNVTVSGTGSTWQAQTLTVAKSGTATLTVSQVGSVQVSSDANVGQNGTLTVTDQGTQFTVGGNLSIGNAGTSGGATIQKQATLNVMGDLSVSGTMTVTDNNTTVTVGGSSTIDSSGTSKGQFTLQDGALFQGDSFTVGGAANSTGTATVSGSGSSLQVNSLTVGGGGTGTLNVNGDGTVNSLGSSVGAQSGGNGTVAIGGDDGAGTWNLNGNLTVGGGGAGQVTISDGGTINLNGNNITLGSQAGSGGTLTLDGDNGTLSNVNAVKVGDSGGGSLIMVNGANATFSTLTVGASDGGNGDVLVSDAGTQLTTVGGLSTSGNVTIGGKGTGTIEITNGAAVLTNGNASVGSSIGGVGTVTMTIGGGWQVDGSLTVGGAGQGNVLVNGNSALSVKGNITVGSSSPSGTGVLTVDGSTAGTNQYSSLVYGATLSVGSYGTGQLNVLNGAKAQPLSGTGTGNIVIAANTGSTGAVSVSGAHSELDYRNGLTVGSSGMGTLSVAKGGLVDYAAGSKGSVVIAANQGATGSTTTIDGAGSRLNASTLTLGSASSTGALQVSNGGLLDVATKITLNAGSTIDTSTGTTTVGSVSNSSIGDLTVGSGGTLKGGGNVIGNLVNAGGLIDLGDPDVLSLTGNYAQTGGTLLFDVYGNDVGDYDQLTATGNINITGGTIEVNFIDGLLPPADQVFDFISAASLDLTDVNYIIAGLGNTVDYTMSANNGALAINILGAGQPPSPVPEPPTALLFATGALGMMLVRRRKKSRRTRKATATETHTTTPVAA